MIVRRILVLLPLCLLLVGCPQRRTVGKKKNAPVAGNKGTQPVKQGSRKNTGSPPSTGRKKPAPPPKGPKSANPVNSKYQCTVAGNCILEPKTCCPACLGIDVSGMQAMNRVQWKKFQQQCKAKKVECKRCKDPGFDVNFVVLCEANKCVVRDFRKTSHATCSGNDDCVLTSAACCDCSGPPVALGKDGVASFRSERCSAKGCKGCKAAEFTGITTACVKGKCVMKGQWKKKKVRSAPAKKK